MEEGGGLPTNLLVIVIAVMVFVFGVAGLVISRVLLTAF